LEQKGFKFNPLDPCVANQEKIGLQHTLLFYVDNLKSSHKDPKVNDKFEQWLQTNHGQHGKVVNHCGKVHEYLGMEIDYTKKGKVIFGMIKYVQNMIRDFPQTLKSTDNAMMPAGDGLFNEGQGRKLPMERAEAYHTMVAKGLFLCKCARPDIQPTIAVLCTRVKDPNKADWGKLIRMMEYRHGTKKKRLHLSAGNLRCIKWYVDASFAVHPNFKSQTGTMSFDNGKGAVQSISRKQKLNTKSSTTEAELAGLQCISYDSMDQVVPGRTRNKATRLRRIYCTKTTRVLLY
jgi:hypothetical protein